MKNDIFADIAASGIYSGKEGLAEPQPPQLSDKKLEFNNLDAAFIPCKKMNSAEELYQEVERQKKYYEPFFQDLAPTFPEYRTRKKLKQFQWRIGTDEDVANYRPY